MLIIGGWDHRGMGLERTGGREAAADHVAHLVDDLGATPGGWECLG